MKSAVWVSFLIHGLIALGALSFTDRRLGQSLFNDQILLRLSAPVRVSLHVSAKAPAVTLRSPEAPITPRHSATLKSQAIASAAPQTIMPSGGPMTPQIAEPFAQTFTRQSGEHKTLGVEGSARGRFHPIESLRDLQPAYPLESRRRLEEGTVQLEVTVRPDGKVECIKVRSSSGYPRLDRAAIEELKRASFRPAMADGRAIQDRKIYSFKFQIN